MGYGEEANFILCCSCAVLHCCGSNSNTAALLETRIPTFTFKPITDD
jgi:hypothetical protein